MSSNDGKQLLVFGLSFAQHDNRRMQQVLRHYGKLPELPGNRSNLFLHLNRVAKELMADEAAQDQITQLTEWMTNGGDFPLGATPAPTTSNSGGQTSPAQGSGSASRSSLNPAAPSFYGTRGDHGPGRTLNGQQPTVNQASIPPVYRPPFARLDRHHGRGRTFDGGWEEDNEEEEEEEDNDMVIDEDDEMHGDMDPFTFMPRFQFMPRQRRFSDRQWGTAFSGPGRTLEGPQEGPSMHAAVDETGAAGPANTEGQGQGIHEDDNDLPTRPEDIDALRQLWLEGVTEDEDDDNNKTECPICLEEYPRSKFPKSRTITEFCDHPDKACLNCLDSSITAIIERGALHLLACPICPQKLSPLNIKAYANPTVYKRYKYLKEQSEIPGHYISCTSPVCGGSQPHESDDPMMICNYCQFATCANHRRPWHEGQTCREFDLDDAQIERLEEEEATAKLLSRERLSICPKCGQGVTKSKGCDNMRCQCGQEWCYVCSCSYENILRLGPTAHATFCTYHPNKVKLTKSQQEAARSRIMGLVHGGEVSSELARAREDLRRRRREQIRPKAAEAAEARMQVHREKNKGQETAQGNDGQPQKKKRKIKLVAPWEEGGSTKKPL